MTAIIDYGAGNIRSVEKAMLALGEPVVAVDARKREGGADAALAASLFHYKELEIRQVKEYLREQGVSVRL